MNAARGAVSILAVHDLKTRKVNASGRFEGKDMNARNSDEGRCVKTIVLTFPKRLAMDVATSMENPAIIDVVKKMEPSSPAGRENLDWKKYVIQDLSIY